MNERFSGREFRPTKKYLEERLLHAEEKIRDLRARLAAAEAARDEAARFIEQIYRAAHLNPHFGPDEVVAELRRLSAAESREAALRERFDHLAGRVLFFCAVTGDGQTPEQAIESHFASDPKRHAEPLTDETLAQVRALASPRPTPPEAAPADCLCGGSGTVTMRTLLGDHWVEDKIQCPQCKGAPACGAWRKTAANLAFACRLPTGHDVDHHPNACGHDGCEGLRCLRAEKE